MVEMGLEYVRKSSDRIIKNRGVNEEERETTPSRPICRSWAGREKRATAWLKGTVVDKYESPRQDDQRLVNPIDRHRGLG